MLLAIYVLKGMFDVLCLWDVGMVPQVPKELCAIEDSSFPSYLSTSIPASFFHLQIEGMLEVSKVSYLPFPSNCNHDHHRN